MVTKRDYLIEKGILSADRKRGRWPTVAHKAIEDAVNAGIKFTDGSENVDTGIGVTAEPRFDRPQGIYVFENADGRKFKRSHTSACVNCGYSFQWCYCENGPFQYEYLGISTNYAELLSVPTAPKVATVTEVSPRRGRGRPRRQAA